MREIRNIVLHCTGGPQNQKVGEIINYWRSVLGWKSPGYHRLIEPNGNVIPLQDYSRPTNGVAGNNANSIHISYIGGVDITGKPVDNRTEAQKTQMLRLVRELRAIHPKARILGHRDFPGVKKACPSFDVKTWLKENGIN